MNTLNRFFIALVLLVIGPVYGANNISFFRPKFLSAVGTLTVPPQAAYSVRQVNQYYSGPPLRVRHGTNNSEADVAFDSSGGISATSNVVITSVGTSGYSLGQVVAFSTYYAGADVFVRTWYDQSGNQRHAVQTTAANQPRVVAAGALEVFNSGRTGIRWFDTNANRLLLAPAPMSSANEVTVNMLYKEITRQNSINWALAIDGDVGGRFHAHMSWGDGTTYFDLGGCCAAPQRYTTTTPAAGTAHVSTFMNSVSANTKFMYRNGTAVITGLASSGNVYRISLGSTTGSTANGIFSEFIVFSAALNTTNRNNLEQNQKTYYGTP
jgi:hypothetical protein